MEGDTLKSRHTILPSLDEERLPLGEAQERRHAKSPGHRAVRVGNEHEGQMVFFAEGFLCLGLVFAHAHDLHTPRFQPLEGVAEAAGLRGAARRAGFRVKINEGDALR